jgi:DNA mismatch repair protein MutS
MAKMSSDTPLMQQHRAIKQKYPDAILLFRVGDFYETFGQDAIVASGILGITLTRRNNGAASESELAGFPYHALDTYLHKLVKAGYRVAICDQLEDPKQAKGIVKRGVTELVTPGVATSDKMLDHNRNNFLAGIHLGAMEQLGIALLDISTGEFFIAEGDREYIDKLLQTFLPSEIIFQRSLQKKFKETFAGKYYTYALDEWIFDEPFARETLLRHFGTLSLKGFGVDEFSNGLIAAGAVFHYLKETEHPHLQHITRLQRIIRDEHLWMDRFTLRNLELVSNDRPDQISLLSVLDHTISPMGARLLKRWLLMPLADLGKIHQRLNTVEWLIAQPDVRQQLQSAIKPCGDVERLVSKLPLKKINPREVLHLARGLGQMELIKNTLAASSNDYLRRLAESLHPCLPLAEKIKNTLTENPPVSVGKGDLVAKGIHPELDELRNMANNTKRYLANLQNIEAEKTGISSLRIGFNQVFGYYLEVTHAHKSKVPEQWIRKQTLVNAERYITPELKDFEEKITTAESRILDIEQKVLDDLLLELQDFLPLLQTNGHVLGILDCLCCFAQNAVQYQYRKPLVSDGLLLSLSEARHPVIERTLPPGDPYVANDIILDPEDQQIIILTGPNMSGKSAVLRQTALITLMAHIGSFVPCSHAIVPLTDKIFTRVGASDNLSGGESTFMVEMNETASIINNLSTRSLVLLDEIGRGTSTYDGISIAWSIAEYLHSSPAAPKTLFATHYHELNELESKLPRVRNYHVTNRQLGNKIIFLRKLAAGGSTHSFGIHVARLAGMPPELVERANDILHWLESKHPHEEAENSSAKNRMKNLNQPQDWQLSIFDTQTEVFAAIRRILEGIDINRLTPVEALLKLQEIKNTLH